MTNASGLSTPAGWYPDPAGSEHLRWWDGDAWTAHLAPRPAPTPLPTPAPGFSAAADPAQDRYATQAQELNDFGGYQLTPPGTTPNYGMTMEDASPIQWNTVWVWIIVLAPLAYVLIIDGFLTAFEVGVAANRSLLVVYVIGSFVLGALLIVANIFFGDRDRRTLRKWGYLTTTSPVWMLLPGIYIILRTVRVHRESRHGVAPLVVFVCAYFVSGILSAGLTAIDNATDGATLLTAQQTTFEQQFLKGLNSTGGEFTLVCPPNFSLAVGSQFTCTATEGYDGSTHQIAIQIVTGPNGDASVNVVSVSPAISNLPASP
jgi:hypothetical protein